MSSSAERQRTDVTELCLDIPRMLERLHRHYMDILQSQLQYCGVGDLLPVQVFMLLDIDDDGIGLQQLINRGRYQRSNAFNHVKKLIDHGYLVQARSTHDRRAVRLSLTAKARELCQELRGHLRALDARFCASDAEHAAAHDALRTLGQLEQSWGEFLSYGPR
jgi:DNA-binding MarR family transcriptional regulator